MDVYASRSLSIPTVASLQVLENIYKKNKIKSRSLSIPTVASLQVLVFFRFKEP
jgi:hypothetical protein